MKVPKKYRWGWYENNIKKFLEICMFDDFDNVKLFKIIYGDELQIKPISSQTARYQIDGHSKYELFGLYRKSFIEFKDTKKDKVLATGWYLYFPVDENDKFRNRYLGWRGPSGVAFSIENLGNSNAVFKKLFEFPLPISVHNIAFNEKGEGKRR